MNLVEPIELINKVLERDYGKFEDGRPNWRVAFSEDLIERRKMTHTDEGFPLLFPEVRDVRKYSHIKDRYVLERLEPVEGETDLVTKTSYEVKWTFQDRFDNYLPPRIDACKFIIEAINGSIEKAGVFRKYKDPNVTPEAKMQKVLEVEEFLFGNETDVGDALSYGDAVAGFYPKEEKVSE